MPQQLDPLGAALLKRKMEDMGVEVRTGAGVTALEGVDLRDVEPGHYDLVCLPLRLEGSDGAPARAILLGNGA
jgi:kynurenine formamidase